MSLKKKERIKPVLYKNVQRLRDKDTTNSGFLSGENLVANMM